MIKLKKFVKGITFVKLSRLFLAMFLFCMPFQIRTYIYGGTYFLTGNFNPYTTFFFYLTDLFLLLSFLFWGLAVYNGEIGGKIVTGQKIISTILVLFLIVSLAGVLLSPDKILSFLIVLRLIIFFLLYLLIMNGVLSRNEVINVLIAGILLQAVIGIFQYFLQRSLGLRFLGESNIGQDVEGVAKIDWNGGKILRAYGTFSHANILGGALFMALIFSFYRFSDKLKFLIPLLAVLILALIFTFSRSAVFALIAGFLLYIAVNDGKTSLRYVILGFSLVLFFVVSFNLEGIFFQRFLLGGDIESSTERIRYFDIGGQMLAKNPLGVGPGGFVFSMQDYTGGKLEPWLFQPVHNVFMLAADEQGIVGALLLVLLMGTLFYMLIRYVTGLKKEDGEKSFGYMLIALLGGIITVSFFDHYFLTLYQGQALLFIFLALASAYLKNEEFPLKKS